jgi:pyridoxal phosphate-dependent aminotransferase EpsN
VTDRILMSQALVGDAEERYVLDALRSGWVAPLGPHVDAFEREISERVGVDHALALSSGTAALHLALIHLGARPGTKVVLSSMTFAATANAVAYTGADTVFVDSNADDGNVDTDLMIEAVRTLQDEGEKVVAAIPVDLFGRPCDYAVLEAGLADLDVPLLEDAAESLGASLGGRAAGAFGRAAALSFNGNKIITTSGGGMLVTRHKDWAEKARFLATQARDPAPHYEHSTYGYNYRLSNICAAIGLGQMEVLDARVTRRREIFARYRVALERPGIAFMPEPAGLHSTRWLTALTISLEQTGVTREDIRLMLLEHQIESRPLWKPMHMQPLYTGVTYHGIGVDEGLFADGLCLPSGSDMTDEQQDEVIERITARLETRG